MSACKDTKCFRKKYARDTCNLQLHFWLEKTAYFKMPKGQEQELIGSKRSSLEKVETYTTFKLAETHHFLLW